MSQQMLRSQPGRVEIDVRTDLSTREAPVKYVIVVDADRDRGLVANAVSCVSAAIGKAIPDLVGPGGGDAAGRPHTGLPWFGCTILGADVATLAQLRTRALARPDIFVADMVAMAQQIRVYDEFLDRLATAGESDLDYCAIGLVGPRNPVDKLVRKLPLLS